MGDWGVARMEKMLRACLNWKVIGGLALVGIGVWSVAPNLLVAALPVLLIAVCPLSMMFMMRGMHADQQGASVPRTEHGEGIATSAQRLAELKGRLEQTRSEQESIRREIERLEPAVDDERLSSR